MDDLFDSILACALYDIFPWRFEFIAAISKSVKNFSLSKSTWFSFHYCWPNNTNVRLSLSLADKLKLWTENLQIDVYIDTVTSQEVLKVSNKLLSKPMLLLFIIFLPLALTKPKLSWFLDDLISLEYLNIGKVFRLLLAFY